MFYKYSFGWENFSEIRLEWKSTGKSIEKQNTRFLKSISQMWNLHSMAARQAYFVRKFSGS